MTAPVPIPPQFLERMSLFLGEEYPAFASALERDPVHALRVNTLKLSAKEFQAISPFKLGDTVAWCDSAFTLPESVKEKQSSGNGNASEPGKHPYHLAGLYYLQDPSAMSAAQLLDPQPGDWVLDLTAAPGGKTTQLAARMQGQGLLVANEIKTKRLPPLMINLERWGASNLVVTNETPERLADHFGACFDRVLVDAPCSGEGMFRKDMGARQDWTVEMVRGCSLRQGNILRVAAHLVSPGGHLLYSTCTFSPEENEGVILHFLQEHPEFEIESLPHHPGFMPGKPGWLAEDGNQLDQDYELEKAVRLFPHRVFGEGHFACLLQRKHDHQNAHKSSRGISPLPPSQDKLWRVFCEETLSLELSSNRLQQQGERLYYLPQELPDLKGMRTPIPGVWLGNFRKDRFEPAHPLATFLRPGQARNTLELSSRGKEVISYLRGESLPSTGKSGWTLVTVDGWPLGWGKRVQGVVKNHYPRGWLFNV